MKVQLLKDQKRVYQQDIETYNCHRFFREQFQNQHLRDSSHSRESDIFFGDLLERELIRDWLFFTAAVIFSSIGLDLLLFDVL